MVLEIQLVRLDQWLNIQLRDYKFTVYNHMTNVAVGIHNRIELLRT